MAVYNRDEMMPQYQPETENRRSNMTINELRSTPPGTKQYLDAQLLAIGLARTVPTQRGQRNVQELEVVDQQGVKEKIAYWYDTDKPDFAMPPQQVGQWLRWVVKTKPNGQYLNISGYPEKAASPPQPQSHLTPATQAIIDQHLRPPTAQQAAGAIQDHLAGSRPGDLASQPPINAAPAGTPQQVYNPPPQTPPPTQQDYEVKERKKVLGMCFTNLLAGRLAAICPTEMEKDLGAIAALWRLSAICIDGTGQVGEEPSF